MKYLILLTITSFIIRYGHSQSLQIDSSFGSAGITNSSRPWHMAFQKDGKFVVSRENSALIRYNDNGSVDRSFGTNGELITQIEVTSVAIQNDGKIVVGGVLGYYSHNNFAVQRFNPNGTIDKTFSYDGVHIINFGPGDNYSYGMVIQTDGKILLAGYAYTGSNYDFALARFNVNGSLDTSFSSDGKVVTDFGRDERAYAIVLQGDGKILLGGATGIARHSEEIALARYNTDGSPDSTFAQNGRFTSGFPAGMGDYEAKSLALQAEGKIVVAGIFNTLSRHLFLARYTYNGAVDSTFSDDGILIPEQSDGVSSMAVTTQDNGKIILGGGIGTNNDEDLWLARYSSDGSLDKYFGKEGVEIIDIAYGDAYVTKLNILNNKLYVAGTTADAKGGIIIRYLFNSTSNLFPTISITTPFNHDTFIAGSSIQINATANDIDGSITKVDFYNNNTLIGTATKAPYTLNSIKLLAGDYVIIAKATDDDFHTSTSDTIHISVDDYKVTPTVSIISPANNTHFTAPASISITANTPDTDTSITKVDFYSNDTLIGTITKRPYTFYWKDVPPGKYFITAKATDNDTLVTISDPVEILVSNPKVTPSVSLTSPVTNSTFTTPGSIMITAYTSDTDSSISKVDFFINDTLIGSSTRRPYTFRWNNVPAGNYCITAKATAYNSVFITSQAVHISVSNPKDAPFLSITSPAAIDTFAAPASITITASIRDTNSPIRKIDFYSNDSLLATVTKRPYTFTWKNVAAGIYFITAKATINDTLIITSHASETTVFNASSQTIIPPSVSVTSPKATATFTAPASISISANASDPDGLITKVDFYSDDTLIGTATQSPYSFTWTDVRAGNHSITAKATDNNGLITISDAVRISVSDPKLAPHVSLTSPVSNATFTAPASIIISANAGDTDGSISKVDFYSNDSLLATVTKSPYTFTWKNVAAGQYFIAAKATDNDELKTISNTVGISVSNPKLAPYVSLTSPESNATFAAPASIIISANAGDADGTISKVDFYSNDTLIGTSTQSPYTFTWINVPAGNYSITAKATDNDQMASPSDIIEISVSKRSPNPGVAPSVSLASPIANSAFAAPAPVTITANADDADGYISRVDFYNNDSLIGTSTETPYTFTWQNVPAGNYSIIAKASDNDLLVTSSDTVHITVYKDRVAPFVSITSPAADKTFAEYSTISITANAMDTDGSITKVDFYNNDTLIGTAIESPYTFTLNNLNPGDYSLTAKATDNDSLVSPSAMVHISVLPNKPPTVIITSPGANETFTSPANITLKAAASDPDGKIAKVEFYSGATLLRTITEYPYAFQWEDVGVGSYKITATATDNFGLKTTSYPVSVMVEAKDSIIIKCAPNPATNTMTISTAGFDQNKPLYVSVIASGIVVKMIEVTNSSQTIQLDVSSLVSGIYTIKLTCGDKVVSKQFLKL